MKLIPAVMILILFAAPAIAQNMTAYQHGVQEGLYVGLKMGQLLGQAQAGNITAAAEYNGYLQKYHSGLQSIFGTDPALLQQMMTIYSLGSIETSSPVAPGTTITTTTIGGGSPITITNTTWKPVHAFDASFNRTVPAGMTPDANGRIHGWPVDAYVMWAPSDVDIEKIRSGEIKDPAMGGV